MPRARPAAENSGPDAPARSSCARAGILAGQRLATPTGAVADGGQARRAGRRRHAIVVRSPAFLRPRARLEPQSRALPDAGHFGSGRQPADARAFRPGNRRQPCSLFRLPQLPLSPADSRGFRPPVLGLQGTADRTPSPWFLRSTSWSEPDRVRPSKRRCRHSRRVVLLAAVATADAQAIRTPLRYSGAARGKKIAPFCCLPLVECRQRARAPGPLLNDARTGVVPLMPDGEERLSPETDRAAGDPLPAGTPLRATYAGGGLRACQAD